MSRFPRKSEPVPPALGSQNSGNPKIPQIALAIGVLAVLELKRLRPVRDPSPLAAEMSVALFIHVYAEMVASASPLCGRLRVNLPRLRIRVLL